MRWFPHAALVVTLVAGARPVGAHFPHDPIAQVALWPGEDGETWIVAHYTNEKHPLVLVSHDSGRSFGFVAPAESRHELLDLQYADGQTLFAADGELPTPLVSLDGGWTWETTAPPDSSAVQAVAVSPAYVEDGTLVAATADGVHVSDDGGASWLPLGAFPGGGAQEVALSPAWPGDGFVAAVSDAGELWTTADGGDCWDQAAVPVAGAVTTVALSPAFAGDDRLWVGTSTGDVLRSDDRGGSWQAWEVTVDGSPIGERIRDLLPLAADRMLAIAPDHAVLCSDDGGETWALCSEGIPFAGGQQSPQWGHYSALTTPPDGGSPVALGAWEGLLLSEDDGARWRERCTVGPDYVRALAFAPQYPADPRIFMGTYGGGLFVTDDGGETWAVTADRQPYLFFESIEVPRDFPSDPRLVAIASRKLLLSPDEGASWERVSIPQLETLLFATVSPAFATDDSLFVHGTSAEGRERVVLGTEGGEHWTVVWEAPEDGNERITPPVFSADYASTGAVYAVRSEPVELLRSDDLGQTWTAVARLDVEEPRIAALFVLDEQGVDRWVAVTAAGEVRSGTGDDSDVQIQPSIGRIVLSGHLVGEDGPHGPIPYLSLAPPGLTRSLDGGRTWEDLPVPFLTTVLRVAAPPDHPDDATVLASTHHGVYYSCDGGEQWSLFDTLMRLEEDSCAVHYDGSGWAEESGEHTGTHTRASATAGDVATVGVVGDAVSWLAAKGPDGGRATVHADGELAGEVDLFADGPTVSDAVFTHAFAQGGAHELTIEIVQGRVDVDAFEVVRADLLNGPNRWQRGDWCIGEDPDTEPPSPPAAADGCCPAGSGGRSGGVQATALLLLLCIRRRFPGDGSIPRGAGATIGRGGLLCLALAAAPCLACSPDRDPADDPTAPGEVTDLEVQFDDQFPTVARVSWQTDVPGHSWVAYGVDLELLTPVTEEATSDHERVVLGLPAGAEISIQAFTETADGITLASDVHTASIAPPPDELPWIDITVFDEARMHEARWLLVAFVQSHGAWVAIIDRAGDYVWYVRTDEDLLTSTPKPGRDGGSLLYAQWDIAQQVDVGGVIRQPLDGSPRTQSVTVTGHHDFDELPGGDLGWIGLIVETWTVDEVEQPIAVDVILEAPEGVGHDEPHETIWSYSQDQQPFETCQHFHAEAFATGAADWSHANSLMYVEDDDAWTIMSKNLDSIHKVDRVTGHTVWQMGGAESDFTMVGGEEGWWSHGHMSHIWPGGMVVFDNRYHDPTQDGAPGVSRVVEYAWSEATLEVEPIWQYEDPEGRFIPLFGDARKLDNGNVLTSWMTAGLLREIAPDGTVVWQAENELGSSTGRIRLLEDLYDLTASQ